MFTAIAKRYFLNAQVDVKGFGQPTDAIWVFFVFRKD